MSFEIFVAVAADEGYALPLATTISSVLANLDPKHRLRLVVVDGGISERSRRRIERVAASGLVESRVEWHKVELARFADAKVAHTGSSANYLRLAIPEIVSGRTDKVVYLDCDLLIRSDLAGLWCAAHAPSDVPASAVRDYVFTDLGSSFGSEGAHAMGLSSDVPYFNSGVLIIDVARWREEDVSAQALRVAEQKKDLMRFSDQDALNVVLAGRWKALDAKWNVMLNYLSRYSVSDDRQANEAYREELLADGFILHFGGLTKPWRSGYTGRKGRLYRSVLYDSGWFDSRIEKSLWILRYWIHPDTLRPLKKRFAKRFPRAYGYLKSLSGNPPPKG